MHSGPMDLNDYEWFISLHQTRNSHRETPYAVIKPFVTEIALNCLQLEMHHDVEFVSTEEKQTVFEHELVAGNCNPSLLAITEVLLDLLKQLPKDRLVPVHHPDRKSPITRKQLFIQISREISSGIQVSVLVL